MTNGTCTYNLGARAPRGVSIWRAPGNNRGNGDGGVPRTAGDALRLVTEQPVPVQRTRQQLAERRQYLLSVLEDALAMLDNEVDEDFL